MIIVTVKHLRAAGMCNREPRIWFKAHGLSWSDFVTEGLPEDVLVATGDPLAMKVVWVARREAQANQRRPAPMSGSNAE